MKRVFKKLLFLACVISVFVSCNKVDRNDVESQENDVSQVVSLESNPETEQLKPGDYEYEVVDGGIFLQEHYYNGETTIVVPECVDGMSVVGVGPWLFYQHKNTQTIILPKGLNTIDGATFYRCYSLKSIVIPASVEEITTNPFFRASSLESIKVEEGNKFFEEENGILYTKNKTELICYPEGKTEEEYIIPSTVISLGEAPFGYKTKLKKITIPSSVTNLPDYNIFVFPDDITLVVEKGSAAEAYAIKWDLNYDLLD